MNPCPCGYHGHPRIPCHCAPATVRRYQQRISGPLLDRIDLRISLQPAPVEVLVGGVGGASTAGSGSKASGAELSLAVQRVRGWAARGCGPVSGVNAALGAEELDRLAPLCTEARDLLQRAAETQALSARAIQSVRRVAMTVSQLGGSGDPEIAAASVAMALGLRGGL